MYIFKIKQIPSLLSDILYIRVYYLLYLKTLKFIAIELAKRSLYASAAINN